MSIAPHLLAACLFTAVLSGGAVAQEKPPSAVPGAPGQAHGAPQDLEPAVDTSAAADDVRRPKHRPTSAAAPSAKPAGEPSGTIAGKPKGNAKDRIDLDPTQITGNRELPKVLYIVPWKRSDLSDLAGRPANSLLDEVLMPVDRDVFKRENRYYGALQPDEPRPGGRAAATAAPAAESRAADALPARDEK